MRHHTWSRRYDAHPNLAHAAVTARYGKLAALAAILGIMRVSVPPEKRQILENDTKIDITIVTAEAYRYEVNHSLASSMVGNTSVAQVSPRVAN